MKIYVVIANDKENYSVLDTAFRSKESANLAILVQKKLFPTCEYNVVKVNLEKERLN